MADPDPIVDARRRLKAAEDGSGDSSSVTLDAALDLAGLLVRGGQHLKANELLNRVMSNRPTGAGEWDHDDLEAAHLLGISRWWLGDLPGAKEIQIQILDQYRFRDSAGSRGAFQQAANLVSTLVPLGEARGIGGAIDDIVDVSWLQQASRPSSLAQSTSSAGRDI
jgi:hypothetical protein